MRFNLLLITITIFGTAIPLLISNQVRINSTTISTTTTGSTSTISSTSTSTGSTTFPPTTAPTCTTFDYEYPIFQSIEEKLFASLNNQIVYLKWYFVIYNPLTGLNEGNLTFNDILLDQNVIQGTYSVIHDDTFYYVFYHKYSDQAYLYVSKIDSSFTIVWTSVFSNNKMTGEIILPKIYNNEIYVLNFVIGPVTNAVLKIDLNGNGVFIPLNDVFSIYFTRSIEIINGNIFIYRYLMQFDLLKYDPTGTLIAANYGASGGFYNSGSGNDGNFLYLSFNCYMYQYDQDLNLVLFPTFEPLCTPDYTGINGLNYYNQTIYIIGFNDTKPLLIVYSTLTNSTLNLVPYQTSTGVQSVSVDYNYMNRILYFGGSTIVPSYIINAFCYY